jgi:primosomal protein N' (replication factor Y)
MASIAVLPRHGKIGHQPLRGVTRYPDSMPAYCDVGLPVPVDQLFTYACGAMPVQVGARVLVPFRGQQLMGVALRVYDDAPTDSFEIRPVQQVLDQEPLLGPELLELARWVAAYYVAPLGEVLRGMLPLMAEVRQHLFYRIAEQGRKVLYEGAERGSSRRSRLTPEQQNREYAVLNYLEDGEAAKLQALRAATQANRALLDGMVRKRWLTREAVAEERDARRVERWAVLVEDARLEDAVENGSSEVLATATMPRPKLNEKQLAVLAELAAAGGRMPLRELRQKEISESSLATLVRRGAVHWEEVQERFHLGAPVDGKKSAHEHTLNETQTEALASIVAAMDKGGFQPHLLFGVTGSGKTAVYVAAMQRALAAGRSALLLVPEIGLTPGMAGQMVAAFGDEVALLHSGLTPDERAEQWHRIRQGHARIVIGTRSAIFAPLKDPGLLIVDEEHDSSYKQEETPRYHARDVAVMRAKLAGIPVVLGSATPSLESWRNAELGRYRLLTMQQRVADRPMPEVELIDMRAEFLDAKTEAVFSRALLAETHATLARGEQAIILLNRRGYSFVVLCRSCGEKIQCENCAISMTYHRPPETGELHAMAGQRLECHYCGFRRRVPERCPHCDSEHLYYLGAGSQQGEELLQGLFPEARIGRMDRDTIRGRGDMERMLARLHAGEINLLVGTQMIAKGHDIHGVTLVGVVGADFALGLPDFRAAERVFQLLTQVSGRAGRGELPGRVIVQTYHPDHYAVQFAVGHDYPGFAAKELQFRRWMHYPPFGVLANVVVQSEKLEEASAWSLALGHWFQQQGFAGLRVLGPAAAPISRLKRIYRFHFVLKAERRSQLQPILRAMRLFANEQEIPPRSVVIDVDAVHLM